MTRSKRFLSGLATSYAAIGVNMIHTLASVPLALHYLTKEEFGLWALISQLSGYLMLLEFGMTGSVARFLTDHKDDINGGSYGNILRTGSRVFAIQGLLVIVAGAAIAWGATGMLDLPAGLSGIFSILFFIQSLLCGLKLASGTLTSPLWSHQRIDISNFSSCLSLVVNFAVLWLGFHLGWRLQAMSAAAAAGFAVGLVFCYLSCRKLALYPASHARGRFDRQLFREMTGFGGGIFLLNIGAQLASASQIIIASRLLGLEGASVWAIATKISTLAQQFVGKILESSAGGLAEMVARGEHERLLQRFRDIVILSATVAITAAAGIALMNQPFIEVWTDGRITWPVVNNLLLAAVVLVTSIVKCHIGLVGITKSIGGMKYVHLAEGVCFVGLALVLVPRYDLSGMLIATLCCNLCITGIYSVWRSARYFHLGVGRVSAWVGRPAAAFAVVCLLFLLFLQPDVAGQESPHRLILAGLLFALVFLPTLWWFGIARAIRREIIALGTAMLGKVFSGLSRRHAK